MSTPVLAFFNNRGGAGTTSLIYHLAWMYADLGIRPVTVDLDPQANLSGAFLSDHHLAKLWVDENHARTIYGCINPLLDGTGNKATPHIELIDEGSYSLSMLDEPLFLSSGSRMALVAGDPALAQFEDRFSEAWSGCLDGDPGAFRVFCALWMIVQQAADLHKADLILVDSGSHLGP
ncbi:MAG TPA: AAA family ATPase [Ktedonobacteraceae bacterium]|jgi:cellulose biosynthesis protein BcsQ